jgi:lipopolysaccharide export LptBFGC system permease protein LptF
VNRIRNSFLLLLPGFGLLFLVLAVIEFFFSGEHGILPAFAFAWHLNKAFQASCDWVGPLLATSVLLSFGLFPEKDGPSSGRKTGGSVILALFAAALCAGTVTFLKPLSPRSSRKARGLSRPANGRAWRRPSTIWATYRRRTSVI